MKSTRLKLGPTGILIALVVVHLYGAAPNDPLYSLQWHLRNTGQGGGTAGNDANVESVWNTFQGSSNEVIAIVDDGLQIAHEDLAPNVVAGLSRNYVNGSTDPSPTTSTDRHGTSVAGVAAARGSNGVGVSGVAPFARLAGFNFLAGPQTAANEADALSRSNQIVDIYSSSWGPEDGGNTLDAIPALTESALASGVASGRNGRGNIYVWAAGNGGANDNSNYDGYANSRYAIAVSASTNKGTKSSYSEDGANITVNAPSNGGSLGITTTDLTGLDGYNPSEAASPAGSTNYTSIFGGTSSAAPLVSGVAALMLQANSNLGWRDVRAIMAITAAKNNPNDSNWTTNAAGYHIHPGLGFGRIDAQAAVTKALSWTTLGAEQTAQGSATPNTTIPDSPGANTFGPAVTSPITVASSFNVEFAEIFFSSTDHTYWGDLQIELRSPAGTVSVLSTPHTASTFGPYDNWRFGSVRHLGEQSQGTWTLTVRDGGPLDVGTFQRWTLKLYGSNFGSNGATGAVSGGGGGGGGTTGLTLTVSVSGNGTVASNPSGITCGSDCSEPYTSGSTVALTPTPGAGSAFAGWSGSSDCHDGQVLVTAATACTAVFTSIGSSQSTRFVDLNGEGVGDAFFYNPSSGNWSMAFGTGTSFNFVNSSWSAGWTVAPGYFNGDNLVDFFVYNPQAGAAVICYVNGGGNFSGFKSEGWSAGWDVRLARLNNDALTDIFLYSRGTGQWFRCVNNGNGFTYTTSSWSPQWTTTIADFNGDGLDDVFLYMDSSGQWFQCLNTGSDFTYTTESWSPGWRMFRGRLNQDSREDLFLYNASSGVWVQCFSNGAGGFSRYVSGTWSAGWNVSLTDFNRDTIADVLLYSAATGQYFQFITSAAGDFASSSTGSVAAGYTVIAAR